MIKNPFWCCGSYTVPSVFNIKPMTVEQRLWYLYNQNKELKAQITALTARVAALESTKVEA